MAKQRGKEQQHHVRRHQEDTHAEPNRNAKPHDGAKQHEKRRHRAGQGRGRNPDAPSEGKNECHQVDRERNDPDQGMVRFTEICVVTARNSPEGTNAAAIQ